MAAKGSGVGAGAAATVAVASFGGRCSGDDAAAPSRPFGRIQ